MSNNAKKNTGFRGIRNAEYKLAYMQKKDGSQDAFFFNIKQDPFELNNIYQKDDQRVLALKASLLQWLQKTNDTFIIQE